ncbi:TetR/AcrR family transcriptional regulator [Sphingobium sp. YR768]|uniref:TetR/AcrR family transcriptional regulator n=1 Tax=Sphingobium sp. YR768 TaxID=1884365 RepID=UPI0008B73012|nr:TetR/AcrR family transcriptional regulator [Sphingobium sp. YR768]SER69600.1 transcriptional regulator, TetR family [Sphingobium sp. YR768]
MPRSDSTLSSPVSPKPRRGRGRPAHADGDAAPVSARLLDAATALFAEQGFDAVGVRPIANRAGVDPAMIAHHFGSKLALWEAVVDRLSLRLTDRLAAVALGPGSASARLDEAVGQIIDLLCDAPELAAFILREVVLPSDRSAYGAARLADPIHHILRPLIADVAAEHRADIDVDYLFVALNGAIVVSIVSHPLLDRLADPADDAQFRIRLKATMAAQMAARIAQ